MNKMLEENNNVSIEDLIQKVINYLYKKIQNQTLLDVNDIKLFDIIINSKKD